MIGYVNSIQSMGTVDGPGVRFVVFLQGCNLRCGCCHNPDTWNQNEGKQYSPLDIAKMAERYKEYFGELGGITVSGGEPLLQADFIYELFKICHEKGINTCLDTSGSIINDSVEKLLSVTDRVLLDIKYTEDELYIKHVGCSMKKPLEFLEQLEKANIPVTLRQVIIPSINNNDDNICRLKEIANSHNCVDKVELLPFKKICKVKYDTLGIEFPFADIPVPTKEEMVRLESMLK